MLMSNLASFYAFKTLTDPLRQSNETEYVVCVFLSFIFLILAIAVL